MLQRIPTLLLCLLVVLTFAACDSDGDDDTSSGGGGSEVPSSGVEATIDGESFVGTVLALASRDRDGFINVIGSDGMQSLGLTIEAGAEGTYQMDTDAGTTGAFVRFNADGTFAETFSTEIGGGGSVRITSISQTQVAGTFSFTANSANSSGSVNVSGGFNVNLVQE